MSENLSARFVLSSPPTVYDGVARELRPKEKEAGNAASKHSDRGNLIREPHLPKHERRIERGLAVRVITADGRRGRRPC